MKDELGHMKDRVLRHLEKHAANGKSIRQRIQRNNLHLDDAELYNQAVSELAREGVVEIFDEGPRHTKYIRLVVDEMAAML